MGSRESIRLDRSARRYFGMTLLLTFVSMGCQVILSIGDTDNRQTAPDTERPSIDDASDQEGGKPNEPELNTGGNHNFTHDDAGLAGRGGAAGSAPITHPNETCEPSMCCVDGRQYFPTAPSPNNICERCTPAIDTLGFSDVEDGTGCGTGCECKSGKPTETRCDDGKDNDDDGAHDCGDLECIRQVCTASPRQRELIATRDVPHDPTGLLVDGSRTISLRWHHGDSVKFGAVLEFENVPANSALKVINARLRIYVDTGTSPLRVVDPSGNEVAHSGEVKPGTEFFDVTSLVKTWVASKDHRRHLIVELMNPINSVVMRTTEYGVDTAPMLTITYEALCEPSGTCATITN
jgi:hypothetical protein